jgi:hypothetical protein
MHHLAGMVRYRADLDDGNWTLVQLDRPFQPANISV